MTKRHRATGLRLKGRSFGQHAKDGPVTHIRIRRRAKKSEPEPPEPKAEAEPKAEGEVGSDN